MIINKLRCTAEYLNMLHDAAVKILQPPSPWSTVGSATC